MTSCDDVTLHPDRTPVQAAILNMPIYMMNMLRSSVHECVLKLSTLDRVAFDVTVDVHVFISFPDT